MKKVLVSLVGGRPLPIILVTLYIRPDILYLIISEDYVKEDANAERIKQSLPDNIIFGHDYIVNPYNIRESMNISKKIINKHRSDEIYFNLTPGTKQMAIGAYEGLKQLMNSSKDINIDICFFAGGKLYCEFAGKQETVFIGLGDYFKAYGWRVKWKEEEDSLLKQLSYLLVDNLSIAQPFLKNLRNKMQGEKTKNEIIVRLQDLSASEKKLMKDIKGLGVISELKELGSVLEFKLTKDAFFKFLLSGEWLEYYVYSVGLNLLKDSVFEQCAWGVTDNNFKGEIDFAAIFKGQLIITSCKVEEKFKRAWFDDLHSKGEQLGKSICSKLLISSSFRKNKNQNDLENIERWSNERKIVTLFGEDLDSLEGIFRKIALSGNGSNLPHIKTYPRI